MNGEEGEGRAKPRLEIYLWTISNFAPEKGSQSYTRKSFILKSFSPPRQEEKFFRCTPSWLVVTGLGNRRGSSEGERESGRTADAVPVRSRVWSAS